MKKLKNWKVFEKVQIKASQSLSQIKGGEGSGLNTVQLIIAEDHVIL